MDYLTFVLFLLLAWIAMHLLLSIFQNTRKKLPPGPSPWPMFGNIFSLGSKPHITLAQLAKTYGPLMTLQLGQVTTVVISSAAVAKEALQNNDALFSNRTVLDAVRPLNHHESSVVWLPVEHKWRTLRKICNSQFFSNARLDASQSLRRNKVNDLVSYVEKCSEAGVTVDIGQLAFSTSVNLLFSTIFSADLCDPSSEFCYELRKVVRGIMEEAGKTNFSDYFPLLKKIDPQGIKRRMGGHFLRMVELFNDMIDQVKNKSSGSIKGSYALDAMLGVNQDGIEEIEPSLMATLVLDLFQAGTDTTTSTLEWAMAELIRNPEKLKKAQSELDKVIGKGNHVEEPNIEQLPYLQAVVKETLRLHPPVPFLVPRKPESDVQLYGCTIPRNAQVLVNVWAMGKDPNIWEKPNLFEPERFLGSDIDVKGHDFELIPFGAGRRICPGLQLAGRMLHLMLSSLIHGFNWKLEDEISVEKMDMEEKFGFTLEKAKPLRAIPACV